MIALLAPDCPTYAEAQQELRDIQAGKLPTQEFDPTCGVGMNGSLGGDLLQDPGGTAGRIVHNVALDPFIQDLKGSLATVAKSSATFFTSAPTTLSNPMLDTVNFLRGQTAWVAALVMFVSLGIGATKVALGQKGEDLADIGKAFGVWIAISGGSLAVVAVLFQLANRLSVWIIDQATAGSSFEENLTTLLVAPDQALNGVLLLIVLVLAALGSLWLYASLTVRIVVLIPLLAALPVTAASYATEAGKAATLKVLGWILAATITQPAAAFILATSFKLMSSPLATEDGLRAVVFGLVALGLAGITMPAMLRLVAPATAAIVGNSGGSGGGSAAAGVAALAGGPTGAAVVSKGAEAAGSAVGGGASGSATANGSSGSDGASGGSKGSAPTGGEAPAGGGEQTAGKTAAYKWGGTSTSSMN